MYYVLPGLVHLECFWALTCVTSIGWHQLNTAVIQEIAVTLLFKQLKLLLDLCVFGLN